VTIDYLCNDEKYPVTGAWIPLWLGVILVPSVSIAAMQATGTVNPPSAAAVWEFCLVLVWPNL
jgi:CBS-domain-containing membrane protein